MPSDATVDRISDDYVELSARIRGAGLTACRLPSYTLKAALTLMALAAGWAALFVLGDRWLTLVAAAWLGLASTQVVFFGHDAGHHQISGGRIGNRVVGLIAGNVLTGLSFGWWEPKHGAHHAHPNQVGRDPDIGPGAVAFTAQVAAGRRRSGRLAARWQAWTFFPLLSLEGVGLHVSSIRSLWRRRDRPAALEAALMGVHFAGYLTGILWLLSPGKALAFICLQQGVFGVYMGCAFAPNHKGMPIVAADDRLAFAERQVLTARNVTGGRLVTFALGGLNYQIEHHLFPRLPMANLPRVQPWIQAFCVEHGLAYRQDTLIASYRAALTHLQAIGTGHGDPRSPTDPGSRRSTLRSARRLWPAELSLAGERPASPTGSGGSSVAHADGSARAAARWRRPERIADLIAPSGWSRIQAASLWVQRP